MSKSNLNFRGAATKSGARQPLAIEQSTTEIGVTAKSMIVSKT
jgi:hypothetical protein